jgi:hypothetical protein
MVNSTRNVNGETALTHILDNVLYAARDETVHQIMAQNDITTIYDLVVLSFEDLRMVDAVIFTGIGEETVRQLSVPIIRKILALSTWFNG